MPSAVPPNAHAAPLDHDDHEYDDAIEDLLKDLPIERSNANNTTTPGEPARYIDQEIKVKKQRKPIPKLDEERLLSQGGLPRLRKITKARLRFKGKGHEFSDISRLLNTYQLWLDDLYPRAKFRDALVMVEKVGHSNRMKVMRKAWLDDTKPFRKDADTEADAGRHVDLEMSGALPSIGREERADELNGENGVSRSMEEGQRQTTQQSHVDDMHLMDGPDDDELDALLAEDDAVKSNPQPQTNRTTRGPFQEDSDDEDELDALLAAEAARPVNSESRSEAAEKAKKQGDDFADEEEAMAEMGLW